MDSRGQRAPIRVSMTSSQLKELLIDQLVYCVIHARASKTRYLEKFKLNISTCRIQTKLSKRKRLNTKSIYSYNLSENTKSLEDIQLFLDMKHRMFGQPVNYINI
jgi:hypothetical protein